MQTTDTKPADEEVVRTIKKFCFRNDMCVPKYYEMRAAGRGPKEMRYGTAVRISPEAEAEWRRARENPVGEEAAEIARTVKALQERGRKAAKRAVASSKHVSRHTERRGSRAGRGR